MNHTEKRTDRRDRKQKWLGTTIQNAKVCLPAGKFNQPVMHRRHSRSTRGMKKAEHK